MVQLELRPTGSGTDSSCVIPQDFLLSLRQRSSSHLQLVLTLSGARSDVLPISTPEPIQQTYSSPISSSVQWSSLPPINPLALRSITTGSLSLAGVAALVGLGRAGPECVFLEGDVMFLRRDEDSLDLWFSLFKDNFWLEWTNCSGGAWSAHEDDYDGAYAEVDDLLGEPMSEWIETISRRNRSIQVTTRVAALLLLGAARPLVCSSRLRIQRPTPPSHLDSNPHPLTSHFPSSNSTSNAHIPSTPRSFRSLPYEIVDLILYHLIPGRLTKSQHRNVLNWTEDHSTLSPNVSIMDFLQETNCWRWESEIERVNKGLGYE